MAKGLRSSQNKANKSKLRSNVFSAVEDARKERLSAKLLELAAKPRTDAEDMKIEGGQGQEISTGSDATMPVGPEDMDVDQAKGPTPTPDAATRSTGRIQKRRRSKAKAAMVFPNYKKGRRVGPRLSTKQRRKCLRP